MNRDEKIILGLAAAALVAVVIFQKRAAPEPMGDPVTEVGMSLTPETTSTTKGFAYLMQNDPWGFMPPINNMLPTVTIGQGGQTVQNPLDFVKRIGVYMMAPKDK